MFRFTRKPSSGSHSQYLAKITHLVQSGYVELVKDVSVLVNKNKDPATDAHNVKKRGVIKTF